MSNKKKIGAIIALDGEGQYKQAVASAVKETQKLDAAGKLLDATMEGQKNTLEALEKKHEHLTQILASQNKKVDAVSAALKHAQEDQQNFNKRMEEAKTALKQAQDSLEDMAKSGDASTEEIEKQQKKVDQLSEAIKNSEKNYQTAENRINKWETELAKAQTEVQKTTNELNKNSQYLEEARNSTDNCATSIDSMGKQAKQSRKEMEELSDTVEDITTQMEEGSESAGIFGDVLNANLAAEGIGKGLELLKDGAGKVKESMYDVSSASVKLAASTGLSESAAKKYQSVMQQIKGDNFGEDYGDVADAMSEVIQIMGELNDTEMTNVTESALTLRDTFDMDVNESIRAADVMMKTMGVDGTTAFDLIVKGAQNGLNRSGELVDNITEYASLWGQAGFSAEEMFAILENGLDAGAYNLDKVNDYVKEFGNSLADGRIENNLSSFSAGTQSLFEKWKDGEASTSDVFYSVINDLSEMTNQQQALTLASEVWSALGEDNAMQVLTALDDVNDKYKDVKGSMESLKEVRYSDLESAVSGLGAAVQENLIAPIADKALPTVTGLFQKATEIIEGIGSAVNQPKSDIEQFVEEIKKSNDEVNSLIESAQNTISGAETDTAALEEYKNTLLALNGETEKTEFQKFQMKTIISELAGSIPELTSAFNEETGSIQLTNTEIANLIDNQKALIMQQALVDAQKESLEALAQATINKAKADSAVKQILEEGGPQLQSYIELVETGGMITDDASAKYGSLADSLEKAKKEQIEANKSLAEAETQNKTETEALKELNEEYGKLPSATSDAADGISDVGTAAEETARKIDEYGNDLSDLSPEEAAAVTAASKEIADAYNNMRDSIADSIESSISLFDEFSGGTEVTADQILSNLDSQISGIEQWSENMKTLATQAGSGMSQELYDKLAEMGPESANLVQELVNTLESDTDKFAEISSKYAEALSLKEDAGELAGYTLVGEGIKESIEKGLEGIDEAVAEKVQSKIADAAEGIQAAGQNSGESYASGLALSAESAADSGTVLSQAAIEAIKQQITWTQSAAREQAQAYASALRAYQQQSAQAAGALASGARNAIASYQNAFRNAGYNIPVGVASGIRAGQSGAINAAENMAAQALAAAKARLQIHSPSQAFRDEVGAQVSKGFAFGISDKASLAGKAASKMSNKVYTSAVSWLSKYKKSQQTSLEDEKYYWQQVLKHTKSGTSAYKKAMAQLNNVVGQQVGSTALASQINTNFGVSRTTTTGSGKNKKTKKKDAETYYSEIYSAAEKYMSNFQVLNDVSLQQELAYWDAVRGQLKTGTQAWYDATKQVNSLNDQIAQAAKERIAMTASVQSSILDKYKVYYKVSARAEIDYWNLARQQFTAGTDERIEADQKYLESLQDWYDQRKELDEDYAENSKDINDKLADSVKELQDAYKDAVQSRKEDILSSMDLFGSWDATGYNADTLLYNLKTQVAGLALWEQQIEELGQKGLAADLMEELKQMGPDAAANIYSLNQMTAEQLDEYNKLWQQKNALAMSQAVKDNESLRLETNTEITNLRTEAQSELNALNAEYRAALAELNTGISGELADLVNQAGNIGEEAVSRLIAGIGRAADSVDTYNGTTQVVSQVSDQLSALQQEGTVIGGNTLDGLLAAMSDQTKINAASKGVIQSIKRAMEEEAEIHSPARLFRRETGPQIPAGVALGMEDNTKQAERSAQEMMRDTLAAAQEEMKRQQVELQVQMGTLNFSGISRLNRLTESYQPQAPVVNVSMKSVVEAMQQMVSAVGNIAEEVKNLKMIIYPDTIAGQMQPWMDKENGDAAIIRNRGRY